MAKVNVTDEWRLCGMQDDTITILREDGDWIKELIQNLRKCNSGEIKRQAERDFHNSMTERYGGHVSGALLMYVWDKTKPEQVLA